MHGRGVELAASLGSLSINDQTTTDQVPDLACCLFVWGCDTQVLILPSLTCTCIAGCTTDLQSFSSRAEPAALFPCCMIFPGLLGRR